MELIIDNREPNLISLLKDLNPTTANLTHGDIQIHFDKTTFIVLERKTWSDLAASIKDGRYQNQKKHLLETFSPDQLYYIFEGTLDFADNKDISLNGISKNTLLSCVYNTMIRDNIKTFKTHSTLDTAELVRGIFTRLKDDPAKYTNKTTKEEQIVKTHTVTNAHDYFIAALCQIPGISRKTAEAIGERYNNFSSFFINLYTASEKLKLLKEIVTKDTKGKTRKISSSVADALCKFIFSTNGSTTAVQLEEPSNQ